MRKKFTLMFVALLVLMSTIARASTETPGNTGTKDQKVAGTSYTIDGAYVAGTGGTQTSPMQSKGVKVRLNSSNKMVINVNEGYVIEAMTIYAVTNDDSKTNSVTSIKVDGGENLLASSINIPNKNANTAATISVNSTAKTSIELAFGEGASQGVFDFQFTYQMAGPEKFYIMGQGTDGGWDATTEMPFNSTASAFEYEVSVTGDTYLCFGDAPFTTWDAFNNIHRYALSASDAVEPALGSETGQQLVIGNGDACVLLKEHGKYVLGVTKDLKLKVTMTEPVVSKVQLKGSWNWNPAEEPLTLTKGDGFVWTGVLDLSDKTEDQEFKLVVNGDKWIGNDSEMAINSPAGWVDGQTSGDYNYILKHATTGFKKYNVTATWAENNKWSLGLEAVPTPITISPTSGDIAEALAAAIKGVEKVGDITINLSANGNYTLSAPITVYGNLTVKGNGAKVAVSEGMTGRLFQMAAANGLTPNSKGFYVFDKFDVSGITFTGVPSYVYDDMGFAYVFNKFSFDNCNFECVNSSQIDAPFRFQAGGPLEFDLTNSTMYKKGSANIKYLVKVSSGNYPDKAFDTFTGPYVWNLQNNTIVGICSEKKLLNGGRVSQNFAKTSITLKKNIFVDCGDGNSFLKDLFGGKNSASDRSMFVAINHSDNTYFWNGSAVAGIDTYDKGNLLTTDPTFAKAEEGDFHIGKSTAQAYQKTGDPRWLVAYEAPENAQAVDVTIGTGEAAAPKDLTAAFKEKVSEIVNAGNIVGSVTINLAADGEYTVSEPIEPSANVIITGPATGTAPVIDASSLEGSGLINYARVTGEKAMKDETTESAYTIVNQVTIENVKVAGLTKSLINNASGQKTLFKDITVNNAVIEVSGSNNFLALGTAYPNELKITNSTIWSKTSHKGFFFKADGKPADVNSKETTTWTVDKSTLVNIAVGKKANNSNGGIKGKNTTTMVLTNSILYNFGSNKGNEVNGWLWGQNGGANATYENNTYWSADGVVSGWTDSTKGGSDQSETALITSPKFADVENGDFTVQNNTAQAKYQTGDPRWLPDGGYVKSTFSAMVAEALGEVEEGAATLTLFEDYTGDDKDDAAVEIPAGKQLTIDGDGHTLELGEATNFVLNGDFTLKNLTIDATALTNPLIQMAVVESPTEWTEANVTVKGVKVNGLKKALFYSACKNYVAKDFVIDDCVVELAANVTTIDYTKGSTALNLTVTNSTFYAPTATTAAFYSSQSGQKATEYNEDAVQTFTFKDNTMYNLAMTKNFFSHRQSNQKWMTYDVEDNIFVNCGKKGQTIKGMNGGSGGTNPTWIIKGNAFNFEGADTSASETTDDEAEPVQESVPDVVAFADAENGDFTVGETSIVAYAQVGDPRWLKDFVAPAYFIGTEGNMTQLEYNKDAKKYEYEFTLDQITKYVIENDENTQYYLQGKDGAEDLMGEKNVVLDTEYGLVPVQLLRGAYNIEASTLVFMPGTYKVTITPSYPYYNIVITGTPDNSDSDGTLVVVDAADGDAFHFGEDGTDNGHMMTMIDATGLYLKIYEGVVLGPGYYPFHIVANNADDAEGGQGGVIISEGGKYDVAIVYDPVLDRVSVNAVKSGTTGIDGITIDELINGAIFNLNGQRVNSAKKGLYIINGHKVVIK